MAAHDVPVGEVPADPPRFNPEVLLDAEGRIAWVPELVLGVELQETWHPELEQAISGRVRRLQTLFHPDRPTGNADLSR